MFIGLILVAVGTIALLVSLGVLTGSIWNYIWPVILIVLGLSLMFGWRRRHPFGRHGCCSSENDDKK
jgi:membrane protein implicated in regulation of membrane protease activity